MTHTILRHNALISDLIHSKYRNTTKNEKLHDEKNIFLNTFILQIVTMSHIYTIIGVVFILNTWHTTYSYHSYIIFKSTVNVKNNLKYTQKR